MFAAFQVYPQHVIKALQEARQEAVERMIAEAQSMGANAILNVRFATTSIAAGAAEILAYGSAVQLDGI